MIPNNRTIAFIKSSWDIEKLHIESYTFELHLYSKNLRQKTRGVFSQAMQIIQATKFFNKPLNPKHIIKNASNCHYIPNASYSILHGFELSGPAKALVNSSLGPSILHEVMWESQKPSIPWSFGSWDFNHVNGLGNEVPIHFCYKISFLVPNNRVGIPWSKRALNFRDPEYMPCPPWLKVFVF